MAECNAVTQKSSVNPGTEWCSQFRSDAQDGYCWHLGDQRLDWQGKVNNFLMVGKTAN